MNLKTCLTVFFISVGLFSCSEDHIINDDDPETEIVYDATLSLVLKHDTTQVQTKANTTWNKSSDFVGKLSVAVFQQDKLVAFKEGFDTKGVYQLDEIKVPSGAVKIVILANTNTEGLHANNTDISLYEKKMSYLMEEVNGSLSMSSGVLEYDLRAGHNFIGYGENDYKGDISVDHGGIVVSGYELKGKPIELTRNVAQVYLNRLRVRPVKDEYKGKGKVYFTLKEIFLTDVKSYSKSIWKKLDDENTTVEVSPSDAPSTGKNENFWWNGNSIGALVVDADKKDFFRYDFNNPPRTIENYNELYFYLNGVWDITLTQGGKLEIPAISGLNKDELTISNDELSQLGYGNEIPIGVNFYIYENTDESRLTSLVVKGDYSYCPNKEGEYETIENTYYTIVINKEGKSAVYEKSGQIVIGTKDVPKYIRQNSRYSINLTLLGPGSNKPSEAHVSATISVKNWDVVEQSEEVD